MSAAVGISKQTFLIWGTYMCVILFHSSTLKSAVQAIIGVLLVQIAGYLILPSAASRTDKKILPYLAVLFAVVTGVLIQLLFGRIPFWIQTVPAGSARILEDFVPFKDPLYLLILVPLLVDMATDPKKYKGFSAVKSFGFFSCMIAAVAFIRELLGFGSVAGTRIISAGSEPVPFLSHTSGAAFLLLVLTLLILFICRRITGTRYVLAVLDEPAHFSKMPVLKRAEELDNLFCALFSLLAVEPIALILVLLTAYVFPQDIAFEYILLSGAVLQGLVLGMLYIFAGKNNPYVGRMLRLSWIVPVQTLVLAIPFSLGLKSLIINRGIPTSLIAVVVYLVCAWVLLVCFLLFAKSVRRKLLFGRRPEILTGLPLYLLIGGLLLIVLSGFLPVSVNF